VYIFLKLSNGERLRSCCYFVVVHIIHWFHAKHIDNILNKYYKFKLAMPETYDSFQKIIIMNIFVFKRVLN
jgi:hypothetical protein